MKNAFGSYLYRPALHELYSGCEPVRVVPAFAAHFACVASCQPSVRWAFLRGCVVVAPHYLAHLHCVACPKAFALRSGLQSVAKNYACLSQSVFWAGCPRLLIAIPWGPLCLAEYGCFVLVRG